MTKERIAQLRAHATVFRKNGFINQWFSECLDEIERLQAENERLKKSNRLPDSMQEAFNSGDGSYRP